MHLMKHSRMSINRILGNCARWIIVFLEFYVISLVSLDYDTLICDYMVRAYYFDQYIDLKASILNMGFKLLL